MAAAQRVEKDDHSDFDRRTLRPLKDQEKLFVAHYLTCFSAAKAARKAGYSLTVANAKAGTWVRPDGPKPHVAFAIRAAVEKQQNALTVTRTRVINELAKIGFSNMADYVDFDDDDHPTIKLVDISRDKAAAIKKITIKEYMEGTGKFAREVKEVSLELYDKKGALVELGKHVGLFQGGATGAATGGDIDDDAPAMARDADGNPVQQISNNTTINNFEIQLIPSGQHFFGDDGKLINGTVIQAELDKADALEGFKHIDHHAFDE